jgi:hypothetical protein
MIGIKLRQRRTMSRWIPSFGDKGRWRVQWHRADRRPQPPPPGSTNRLPPLSAKQHDCSSAAEAEAWKSALLARHGANIVVTIIDRAETVDEETRRASVKPRRRGRGDRARDAHRGSSC